MTPSGKSVRCAIYTRVSTDAGLDQEFNSLDAQYEASEAYIRSQAHASWTLIKMRYDDGGFSGGSTDRPALQKLLDDVRARRINIIVVYKVDRLTRSLADFAKLGELYDARLTCWDQHLAFAADAAAVVLLGIRCRSFGSVSYGLHGCFQGWVIATSLCPSAGHSPLSRDTSGCCV